ncbi:MAG: SIS domain-containing protein [Firmicutes bacterium]|nr:SIS domain-containing protein [Bacillota bacterium]
MKRALHKYNNRGLNIFDEGKFNNVVVDLINEIETTQRENIEKAGALISQALSNEGVLHVFSTGNSHMIAEELFYRAGGLI